MTKSDDDKGFMKKVLPDVKPLTTKKKLPSVKVGQSEKSVKITKTASPTQSLENRKSIVGMNISNPIKVIKPSISHFHYDHSISKISSAENMCFFRQGMTNRQIRRLKQGKIKIDADLDLHGATASQAESILIEFLEYCKANKYHYVLIIHGKGSNAILKNCLNQWLRQLDIVTGYCSARAKDGGLGAVYVMLKR